MNFVLKRDRDIAVAVVLLCVKDTPTEISGNKNATGWEFKWVLKWN